MEAPRGHKAYKERVDRGGWRPGTALRARLWVVSAFLVWLLARDLLGRRGGRFQGVRALPPTPLEGPAAGAVRRPGAETASRAVGLRTRIRRAGSPFKRPGTRAVQVVGAFLVSIAIGSNVGPSGPAAESANALSPASRADPPAVELLLSPEVASSAYAPALPAPITPVPSMGGAVEIDGPQNQARFGRSAVTPMRLRDPALDLDFGAGWASESRYLDRDFLLGLSGGWPSEEAATEPSFLPPLAELTVSGKPYNPLTHPGIDFALPSDPSIRASGDGFVIVADACALEDCDYTGASGRPLDINAGYGNVLVIEYPYESLPKSVQDQLLLTEDQSLFILYGHMRDPPSLSPGEAVTAGERIGVVGSSGNSSGPHLHLEIRIGARGGLPPGQMCTSYSCYDPEIALKPEFGDELARYAAWRRLVSVDPYPGGEAFLFDLEG